MKNSLSFFAILFAFCLISCSEETIVSKPDDLLKGEKTYATFVVNIQGAGEVNMDSPSPTTKAYADFNPAPFVDNPALDESINPSDVRLLIFDATGLLEFNELFFNVGGSSPSLSQTVLLSAGLKKIFVLANAGAMINPQMNSLTVGSTTLSQFYSIVFDAGTPQFSWSNKSGSRTFDITPLHTHSGAYGLPSSNTNQFTYLIIPNIGQATSVGGAGSAPLVVDNVTITQQYNNFEIDLIYMAAKARLGYTNAALTHTENASTIANISEIKYSVIHLARYTNYIQNVVGQSPRSYYWGKSFSSNSSTTGPYSDNDYFYHFDEAVNVTQPATPVTGSSGSYTFAANTPYLFVPEIIHDNMTRGMAPYYAINVHYKPTRVVYDVNYNPVSTPSVILTAGDITTLSTTLPSPDNNMDYTLLRVSIGAIEAGTFFKNLSLLQKAAWLAVYGGTLGAWTGSTMQIDYANALIGTPPPASVPSTLPYPVPLYKFYEFKAPNAANGTGGNWYCQLLGSPSDAYGVLRGKAYNAVINEIRGPGTPYEWLIYGSDTPDPIESLTFATTSIKIKSWEMVMQDFVLQ